MAWRLGKFLESPRFQNYAMRRLFTAFSRSSSPVKIPADTYDYVYKIGKLSNLQIISFMQDIVIRNWGDDSVVDHKNMLWPILIQTDAVFQRNFFQGVAIPLDKRRELPMNLNKYFVMED